MHATKSLDDVKDYWNNRSCNLRHSPRAVGSREYFEEVEARKYFVEPHIPLFADFEKWKGKKVLEIGCGIGTDTMNFARAGAELTSVDLSSSSLQLAKKRADVFGLSRKIRFTEANAEELDKYVPPEPYDLIYSFGVLHHTTNPERAFDQLPKYAKEGTELKLMFYYRYSWKVLWILFKYGQGQFWKLDELVSRYSEAQEGCPVTFIYSKDQMREIAEKRGFKVEDIFVDHIFPYKISDYIQYRYKKEWYFRWIPKALFRSLETRFGWHLCLTARYTGKP